jgi:flagellar basal-body rod protein FlgB
MEALFGKTINLLSTMLGFRSERHKLIASNIANIDTPDYRPTELTFRNNLEEALGKNKITLVRTDKRHFPPISDGSTGYRIVNSDGKVELDTEMANLAENQLMYNLTVELLSRKFKGIKNVLTEAK